MQNIFLGSNITADNMQNKGKQSKETNGNIVVIKHNQRHSAPSEGLWVVF